MTHKPKKKLFRRYAKSSINTHLIRLDGMRAFIVRVENDGQDITVSGWDKDHFKYKSKDFVILMDDSEKETRYCIVSITSCDDPPAQYFLYCKFAPRKELTEIIDE